ncbi:hypothetical protein N836_21995 [Leptolyngbya sp. Heron Island J]|uniref:hypothetical protein n=1 Tax=Leptolyngbya sp. Heron Island J TaxID=1385935 RepID=UPI0003B979E6|nr:hypothetical protein [Leptolyngbya sp. Heron Island J]ESA33362.1 hypothetical protein N836_21995 [Leptolyngbya sp. Heron Island J]
MTAPSLRLLLSTLIDYAGLFSPAALNMSAAVAAYERYSRSSYRWMLGRFVVSLSQLPQFETCLEQLSRQYAAAFWPLSIALAPSAEALDRLAPWLKKQNKLTISALEFEMATADAIAPLLPHLPPHSDLFFTVPLDDNTLPNYLSTLQGTRAAVNVHTGGPTAADFPSAEALAQFIVACASARIPFKATDGLSHPLRSWQTLPNGTTVQMHGFLNVALAAAFAYGYSATTAEVTAILNIDTPDALIFLAQEIICQSPNRFQTSAISASARHLPLEILAHVRSRYFLGISSCSFQKPQAELYQLGVTNVIDARATASNCIVRKGAPKTLRLSSV